VKLARQLIDHLSAKRFDPNEFVDEHRARVEAQIKKKVQGKQISLAESLPEKRDGNVIDLMDALKASLERRGGAVNAGKPPKKAAGKRSRRAA
jgi:DNA end-binding protein Ku